MNLVFKSIEINNFLSIRNAKVDFENQGIVMVEGINNDTNPVQSNGSGKSSIFDAILWTIYGETFRGITNVKNINVNDGVFCQLLFTIDDISYIINRSSGHSKYKSNTVVFRNDTLIVDGIKKSQDYIDKLFGISSAKILGSIVLLGQGLPYKFSGLSQSARKDMLEQISGTEDYIARTQSKLTVENDITVSQIKDLEKEYHTNQGILQTYQHQLDTAKQQQQSVSIDDIQKQIEKNTTNISHNNVKIENCTTYANQISSQIEELETQYKSLYGECSSLKTQINTLNIQYNSMNTECPVCHRPYDNAEELETHKKEISDQIDTLNATLKDCSQKCSDMFNNIISQREGLHTFETNKTILVTSSAKLEADNRILSTQLENAKQLDNQVLDLENKIKELLIIINTEKTQIDSLNYYIEHIKWLLRETSREFKGVLLEDAIEAFSKQAQKYAEYLLDEPLKIYLDGNKVAISLNNIVYESLSGGERQRVDLSLQFALRHMLYLTTGFSSNLLVLDEIFDNLDIQGIERLNNLIMSELTDIETIYVVTHHSDVNIAYDKKLIVSKTNGISLVTCYG